MLVRDRARAFRGFGLLRQPIAASTLATPLPVTYTAPTTTTTVAPAPTTAQVALFPTVYSSPTIAPAPITTTAPLPVAAPLPTITILPAAPPPPPTATLAVPPPIVAPMIELAAPLPVPLYAAPTTATQAVPTLLPVYSAPAVVAPVAAPVLAPSPTWLPPPPPPTAAQTVLFPTAPTTTSTPTVKAPMIPADTSLSPTYTPLSTRTLSPGTLAPTVLSSGQVYAPPPVVYPSSSTVIGGKIGTVDPAGNIVQPTGPTSAGGTYMGPATVAPTAAPPSTARSDAGTNPYAGDVQTEFITDPNVAAQAKADGANVVPVVAADGTSGYAVQSVKTGSMAVKVAIGAAGAGLLWWLVKGRHKR